MKALTLLLLAAPLMLLVTIHAADTAPKRPNILHIHADDHRADGLGALGHPVVKTPNLDTLVARGLTFSHCYTMGSMVGAVCLPSRTMMLTGKSWLRIPGRRQGTDEGGNSLPKVMSSAGYETWHCGKGGNEYTVGLKSFDTNLLMDDHGPVLRRGSSERHADAAVKFLQERKAEKPFYIYLAPPVPHDPRVAAPEFHGLYKAKDVPLPPAFMPLHPFDNGEMTVRDEALKISLPGVAFVDMTTTQVEALRHKDYLDLSGNGANHPNDFLHRLYAQRVLEVLAPSPGARP